jgi:DNA-binding transcriptional ArsR family regulator
MKLSSSCSGCFAGLSCNIRIDIINLLKKKNRLTVGEITKHYKKSQPTITHHLLYLKNMGILKSKKEGRSVFYFIDTKCGLGNCDLF